MRSLPSINGRRPKRASRLRFERPSPFASVLPARLHGVGSCHPRGGSPALPSASAGRLWKTGSPEPPPGDVPELLHLADQSPPEEEASVDQRAWPGRWIRSRRGERRQGFEGEPEKEGHSPSIGRFHPEQALGSRPEEGWTAVPNPLSRLGPCRKRTGENGRPRFPC